MPASRPSRKSASDTGPALQFRARIFHRGEIAFGPGKADLLTAIQAHGSLAKAAGSLGMSYMRAWSLVKIMNKSFREPVVILERGGVGGGAAKITPLGEKILGLYHGVIAQSEAATRTKWTQPQELLKK